MTKERIEVEAVLRLALKALKKSDGFLYNWHENDSDDEADIYATVRQLNGQAIIASEKALAQPESDLKPVCFADFQPNHKHDRKCQWCAVETECKTGVAQPAVASEQSAPHGEPVAEIVECSVNGQQTVVEIEGRWKFLKYGAKLYTTPPTQQSCSQRQCNVKPLTDEQLDKEFEAYAAQFDTFSDEWQDMGAGDYFKAGFKAAHGIMSDTDGKE